MVIFESKGFVDGKDRDLKSKMKESYDASFTKWNPYWIQANMDRRYAVGDQRYLNMYANPYFKEQKFVFNIIHSKIQQIVGTQRKGRKSSVVVNRGYGSDQTASQLTKVLMWAFQRDNTLETISEGFYNAAVTGLNLTHIYLDHTDDPFSGDLCTKNFASASFIMDPWWTEFDLSDCSFVWTRDYLNLFQLQSMMPERAKDLELIRPEYESTALRFTFMPEAYQVRYRSKQNYALDSYYYIDERERTMVHHLGTKQAAEFPDHKDLDEFMMLEVPEEERQYIEIVKQKVPSVRLCLAVNDHVMYDEHVGDQYPFVPTVFYFDPETVDYTFRFRGIPRITRDCQYLFNRRTQIQLDTLESLPNSGVNVVEDALVDEKDAFKTGPGQVRVIKKGYMPDQAISNIQPPIVDSAAFQMTENLNTMSTTLLGINEELMGMSDNNDVGITEALRQGAALTTLREPFDKLDISQKILSEYMLGQIQKNFTYSKVMKIVGEEPTEEFFDQVFFEYGCVVEDGLNTTTQRQMQFAQLLQLASLPKIGELIDPADILEASTLQDKHRIISNMQQREQAQQQQAQAQSQLQMQQLQVQNDLLISQSELNRQSGQSKAADSELKIAQIQSEYAENELKAAKAQSEYASVEDKLALTEERRADALRRLDEVPLERLEKLLAMLDKINAHAEKKSIEEVSYG